MQLVIISGRSGAGKSVALHMLEDLGFYCVDGIPLNLLPALIKQSPKNCNKLSVSLDARNFPDDPAELNLILNQIKKQCTDCKIIYLTTDDQTLLKRFSVTRRKHPLTNDKTPLAEALVNEQQLLHPLTEIADVEIDTNRLSVHELRQKIREYVTIEQQPTLTLLFLSFSYKSGIPIESDFVFDVRCLPNPYWRAELRQYNGLDPAVGEYLASIPDVTKMVNEISHFIQQWIPHFKADNRQYLTTAIGCTGGQHRSVYIAEQLAKQFQNQQLPIQIRHRDLP